MAKTPVMLVEVELTCKKCARKDRTEIPVACDVNTEVKGGALVCAMLGEVTHYIKECKKCGSKDFEVEHKEVRMGTGG